MEERRNTRVISGRLCHNRRTLPIKDEIILAKAAAKLLVAHLATLCCVTDAKAICALCVAQSRQLKRRFVNLKIASKFNLVSSNILLAYFRNCRRHVRLVVVANRIFGVDGRTFAMLEFAQRATLVDEKISGRTESTRIAYNLSTLTPTHLTRKCSGSVGI